MITTASDYKKALQESERDLFGNRTWGSQYANIDYSRQKAQAAISQAYGENIAKAYEAATTQRSAIAGTALGEGTKDLLRQDISTALSSAYDQYMANMQSNLSTVESSTEQSYSEIDKMLQERAEKFAEYDAAHYNYLPYLMDWLDKSGNEAAREKFYSNPLWSKYFNIDETGTATLRSWDDLTRPVYDEQTGEYVSFYDSNGNLTDYGKNFYHQVETFYESQMPEEGETLPPSFATYLYEENPELYQWINEDNPYGVALNSFYENKNVGAFRKMLGINSDADVYNFLQYFGGLTPQEVDDTFGEVFSMVDQLSSGGDFSIENLDTVYEKMKRDFKSLGLTGDWNEADMQLKQLKEQLRTAEQTVSDADATLLATDLLGGLMLIAGTVLTATGFAAPLGAYAFAGGTATLAAGNISTGIDVDLAKKDIESLKTQFKETYLNALTYATADIQNRLTESRGAAGGVLGTGLNNGRGPQTLEEYSKTGGTTYESFSRNTRAKSSKRTDISLAGLGSGIKNDHFDLIIGKGDNAQTFRLKSGGELKDERSIEYLNKYTTGDKAKYPKLNTPVVVGGKLYMFTQKGWVTIESSADDATMAAKAFLGKKN